ncbi:hypothetical protein [Thioalkalivibrio sulfidiphilus]|nr:hypothetical protein [Thioalkalivibrio sulfidiphilus]
MAPDDDRPIPDHALAAARRKVLQEAVQPITDPGLNSDTRVGPR